MRRLALAGCLLTLATLAPAASAGDPFGELARAWARAQRAEDRVDTLRRRLRLEHRANRYHARRVRELQRTLRHRADVDEAIRLAAIAYGTDRATLDRKALCESKKAARARNRSSMASGLFQFLASTWATTPYAGTSIWSPYGNALAAGWMHAHGRAGEWDCR